MGGRRAERGGKGSGEEETKKKKKTRRGIKEKPEKEKPKKDVVGGCGELISPPRLAVRPDLPLRKASRKEGRWTNE